MWQWFMLDNHRGNIGVTDSLSLSPQFTRQNWNNRLQLQAVTDYERNSIEIPAHSANTTRSIVKICSLTTDVAFSFASFLREYFLYTDFTSNKGHKICTVLIATNISSTLHAWLFCSIPFSALDIGL
jgi:hypothetical protein